MWHAREARRNTSGATTSAPTRRTAPGVAVNGTLRVRHQWEVLRRMPSVCSIRQVTCGNGWWIAGTTVIRERRMTAAPGREGTVMATCCAAVPGTTTRGTSARPTASGTAPETATATSGSVLPGRWINACFFTSLLLGGLGAEPPERISWPVDVSAFIGRGVM